MKKDEFLFAARKYTEYLKGKIDSLGFDINIADMSHNQIEVIRLFEEKRYLITKLIEIKKIMIQPDADYEQFLSLLPPKFLCSNNKDIPRFALLLLKITITNKKYRKNIIGDLEEDFLENQVLHGTKMAKCIYWKDVINSVPWNVISIISNFIKKLR